MCTYDLINEIFYFEIPLLLRRPKVWLRPIFYMTDPYTFTPLGDRAVVIKLLPQMSGKKYSMSAAGLCERIKLFNLQGITDIVPAFLQLAIHYDPVLWACVSSESPYDAIVQSLTERLADSEIHSDDRTSSLVRVPVCYDTEFGIDLEFLSLKLDLSIPDIVDLHKSPIYTVGAIGFAPGFAYLEGLNSKLVLPRRESPRARVPKGSIAIAANYTGIYPSELPGGWHILGRTRTTFFQWSDNVGSLLAVGDRVQFDALSLTEFLSLESRSVIKDD